MSERKKINSIVSTVLNNNDYRLNRKCLWLLIFSYLFSFLPPAVAMERLISLLPVFCHL